MAITQAIANSFKKQLLDGDQDFTAAPSGDIFKIALYTSSATLNSALIYNTSFSNAAVAVLDFGADKTATSGVFTIQFPAQTSTAAILRISG